MAKQDAPPRWDRKMQQRLARGEAAALGELYDRFASLVHGLAHRVLGDERAADGITREVFTHVWEHPDAYDPQAGPAALLGRRPDPPPAPCSGCAPPRRPRSPRGGDGTAEELERKVRTRLRRRPRRLHRHVHARSAAGRPGTGLLPAPRLPPDRGRPRRHRGRGPPPAPAGPATAVHRPRRRPPGAPPGTEVRGERDADRSRPGRPRGRPRGRCRPPGPRRGPPRRTPGARGQEGPDEGRRAPAPRTAGPPHVGADRPGHPGTRAAIPLPRSSVEDSGRPLPRPRSPNRTRPEPAAARTPGAARPRTRRPEVAARRVGAGGLLGRGDRGRRGAPGRLRSLRRRGAAAARGGRPAAPRGEPRPGPRCCAPGSWRAASTGARPASRCPAGRRRTTRRRPGSTPCSRTSATPSGTPRCGCAGSRTGRRPSRRTTVAGVIAPPAQRRRPGRRRARPGRPARRDGRPRRRTPAARTETYWRASHFPPTRSVRGPWREQSHDLVRTVSFARRRRRAGLGLVPYGDFALPLRRRDAGPRLRVLGARRDIADAVDYPYEPPAPPASAPDDRPGRADAARVAGRAAAGRVCRPRRPRHLVAAGDPGPQPAPGDRGVRAAATG